MMPEWLRALDALSSELHALTARELRALASKADIAGRSKMAKADLVVALMDLAPGRREAGWREIYPMLDVMRVITAADVPMLALTIDAYADYIETRLHTARVGATYETEGRYGIQVKRRPDVEIANRRWEHAKSGLIEFGMSPASRSKIAAVPADEKSALAKLLS